MQLPSLACAIAAIIPFIAAPSASAATPPVPEIQTDSVTYLVGDKTFEGCVSRPVKLEGKVPGVLVAHDWMGFGAFSRERAEQLARLGYIALALDMYGQGVHAKDAKEAAGLAGPFYKDPALFRVRAQAALAKLLEQPGVDPARIGAIGFCFGGSTVLELARSGANFEALVTFHGGLKTTQPAAPGVVKVKEMLILHGSLDPTVPPADVAGFMSEMNAVHVPYRLVAYPNTVHAFTNPEAGNDITKPVAYNKESAEAAYAEMTAFFTRIFSR